MTSTAARLLALTPAAAKQAAITADEQAALRFFLAKIKTKDHRALVKFLTDEQATGAVEADYRTWLQTDAHAIGRAVAERGQDMTLAALVAAVIVIQSVATGEPVRLKFPARRGASATSHEILHDDADYLGDLISKLTDKKLTVSVSEWAEQKRYLPPQVTSMPGYYSFDVNPMLREIADCLSADSPVREVDFMKGAQLGATVGVLENAIGYYMEHVKTAPVMLLTADAELAQLRMESYVTPMIEHSGLSHLIQSADTTNKRKTGKTDKKLEWAGGGFLVPFGAINAAKLRSISVQILLEDECDGYPDKVGKDGDPQALAEARTKGYHLARKIARISTPLIKGRSRIERGFLRGDQRRAYVPCKACGEMQVLRFTGETDDGRRYGLTWLLDDDGALVPDSVRYLCVACGFPHTNADKAWMFPRYEWRPTAVARDPDHRSYHLGGLYSPVTMYPWEAIVRDWLNAWDVQTQRPKDVNLLQEFYNNNLGEPFEMIGARVSFARVSAHRRGEYSFGMVPNKFATEFSGSPVLLVTCQIDVHKSNLAVATVGWTRDAKSFVIDYWRFETDGDCQELSNPVWERVRALLEDTEYTADDGRKYGIAITLIDAGFANDTVCSFCAEYEAGVYPILGRDRPAKNQTIKEFAEFKTQAGTIGYRILVDHYKDRIAPVLRREWTPAAGQQRRYHINLPINATDKQVKELTAEVRREKVDENGSVVYVWHRPGNVPNELGDLMVYGHAAVEIIAWQVCVKHFELDTVDWDRFWEFIDVEKLYYYE